MYQVLFSVSGIQKQISAVFPDYKHTKVPLSEFHKILLTLDSSSMEDESVPFDSFITEIRYLEELGFGDLLVSFLKPVISTKEDEDFWGTVHIYVSEKRSKLNKAVGVFVVEDTGVLLLTKMLDPKVDNSYISKRGDYFIVLCNDVYRADEKEEDAAEF